MKTLKDISQAVNAAARCSVADAPLIGITANVDGRCSKIDNAYAQAVADAGGVPLLIPATGDISVLAATVGRLDALLMSGGGDIDPSFYGQQPIDEKVEIDELRDTCEVALLQLAINRGLPVFGICRGIQLINVFFGGTLYQDVPSQHPDHSLEHMQLPADRGETAHEVCIEKDTELFRLFGSETLGVNSRHHQAIEKVAPTLKISAVATDGIIETVEDFTRHRIFAVQWHPENMAVGGNEIMQRLFRKIVDEGKVYAQAKRIHGSTLIIDSHCDTAMFFAYDDSFDIGRRDDRLKTDFPKMAEGRVDAVFMVAYLKQGDRDEKSLTQATQDATRILNCIKSQVERNSDCAELAKNFSEISDIKRRGKKAVLLGIENGYAIGRDIANIKMFADMGVTYITLCHNGDNDICDSAAGSGEHGGLSDFGREVVREMNRLGLMVDISHAASSTVADVLKVSTKPIIASHSSARALCDHRRNLTDDQIRAVAATGGVVQVCLYHGFIDKENPNLSRAADHIEHIKNLVGADHVGIGTDFDGDGGVDGCDHAGQLINLTCEMLRRGFSEEDIAKIWGGNLCRVMNEVQNV